MASIDKRQTTDGPRYDVRYRGPDRKPRKKTFRRKVDAERFASGLEVDLLRGQWTDPRLGKITFGEWWETWWSTTVNLRPSTRARDESYARNHLLPHFVHLRLLDIDHRAVVTWVHRLGAHGLAPATVVKAHQILGKCLRAAVDAGRIPASPAERVPLPTVEAHEMRFLTPSGVATLADTIDPRYRAFVLLAAYGGLRLGELLGLRRSRVDLLARRVEVAEILVEVSGRQTFGPPKTRAGRRVVPIPRVAASALEDHVAGLGQDELVFRSPTGLPARASLFRRRTWEPAVRASGLEPLRIHDLRDTAVAIWLAAGSTPKEIAVRAGHGSVSVVLDRYGHLLPGSEDRLNDALDNLAATARPAPSATVLRHLSAMAQP